ncbi:MAG: hypothetical protein IT537_10900 [Hyphomicrobiales bacterium]|nr:hypothetical protein [Hyphomicrobiales bacterium]
MKKLVLETTAPFQGLPELVAYNEGLFAEEGLEIAWADREQGVEKKVRTDVTSPKGLNPFVSHSALLHRLPRQERSRDRCLEGRGPPGEPVGCL